MKIRTALGLGALSLGIVTGLATCSNSQPQYHYELVITSDGFAEVQAYPFSSSSIITPTLYGDIDLSLTPEKYFRDYDGDGSIDQLTINDLGKKEGLSLSLNKKGLGIRENYEHFNQYSIWRDEKSREKFGKSVRGNIEPKNPLFVQGDKLLERLKKESERTKPFEELDYRKSWKFDK